MGARAVRSHTGSLAGSSEVFEAMCRQTGAMRADTMEELHDLAIAVSTRARDIRGTRAILVGGGGGFSVLSSDAIARHGFDLPELPDETKQRLREWVPIAGNSIRNPIDAGFIGDNRHEIQHNVTQIASEAPGYDFLFVSTGHFASPRAHGAPPGPGEPKDGAGAAGGDDDGARSPETARSTAQELAELQDASGRPFVVVRRGREFNPEATLAFQEAAYQHGLGAFPSVPRAARAVEMLLQWRARREGLPELF